MESNQPYDAAENTSCRVCQEEIPSAVVCNVCGCCTNCCNMRKYSHVKSHIYMPKFFVYGCKPFVDHYTACLEEDKEALLVTKPFIEIQKAIANTMDFMTLFGRTDMAAQVAYLGVKLAELYSKFLKDNREQLDAYVKRAVQ